MGKAGGERRDREAERQRGRDGDGLELFEVAVVSILSVGLCV